MTIRLLPPNLVNQIAAGEVVERPASAVKELVENAVDAGATRIDIVLSDGGRAMMVVTDNGCGMTPQELIVAVDRHATSKLPLDDLLDINYLGFRGEALPAIGSVARLTVTSRKVGADSGWYVVVAGGRKDGPVPAPHPPGTRVEVRDIFFATPARLKFLKAAQTELSYAVDAVERLAMARPDIAFSLTADGRPRASACRPPPSRAICSTRTSTGWRRSWARISAPTPCRWRRSGKTSSSTAISACRRSIAAMLSPNTCSSTAGRCATACCRARCAPPTRISSPPAAIPMWCCSSTCRSRRWM